MRGALQVLGSIAAAALSASCVIIVQPNPPPKGGNGGNGTGAFSCASTADPGIVTAQILLELRIGRTTANLAKDYAQLAEETATALATAKIVTTQAVMLRLDERPVMEPLLGAWGCSADDPRKLPPADIIDYYATNSDLPSSPIGCATDPLIHFSAHLPAVTEYPARLAGTSGSEVFAEAPSVLLVIHIDDQARRSAYTDGACESAHALAQKDASGNASWIAYPMGTLSADRVVHWFVTTDELVDRAAFVESCKKFDGFPIQALDLIDPSSRALYTPLAAAIQDAGAGHVAQLPLCAALSSMELTKFISQQVHNIAGLVGTSVDDANLKRILAGQSVPGLPNGTSNSGP